VRGISDAQADALHAGRSLRPRGLYDLLRWYEAAVLAECPMKLHRNVTDDSALGSLAWSHEFRKYLEGSPFAETIDGFYERPVMAALAKMEGRTGRESVTVWRIGPDLPKPSEGAILAAFLRDVARNAFSYSEPADRWGFGVIAGTVTLAALEQLYRAYRSEAPARIIHKEAA
jgi:hypothetical protein